MLTPYYFLLVSATVEIICQKKKFLIVKYHFQFQRHVVKANSRKEKKMEEREKGSNKEIDMRQKYKTSYR